MAITFKAEEIFEALRRADLDEEAISKVMGALIAVKYANPRLGGRPPEDDSQRLTIMTALVVAGASRWQAAGIVTQNLPETAREAARKRVYRKFGAPR